MSAHGYGERPAPDPGPRIYRVGEINRILARRIENAYGDVRIEGEITQLTRAKTGHVYFTLSDERDLSQLRCVMFRSDAQRARVKVENGARVRARGSLTIYAQRGSFQLQVRGLVPAGAGDLRARFEALRKKLGEEGLFDDERKRALPRVPRALGVVTSGTSAAFQDVLRVSRERLPLRIVLADCRVQGADAPGSIVDALRAIQRAPGVDAILLTRGGGSAEDLWAFNDERVVREVAACALPIVVGVGHESDLTLAELAADVRASTPSNAAERAVPDRRALRGEVDAVERRLLRALEARVDRERIALSRLRQRVQDPRAAIGAAHRLRGQLERELEMSIRAGLDQRRAQLARLRERVSAADPRARLARRRATLTQLQDRLAGVARDQLSSEQRGLGTSVDELGRAARKAIEREQRQLVTQAARLDAMSPLRVLSRGYAIALRGDGRAIRDANEVEPGDALRVRVARGEVRAEVREIVREGEPESEGAARDGSARAAEGENE